MNGFHKSAAGSLWYTPCTRGPRYRIRNCTHFGCRPGAEAIDAEPYTLWLPPRRSEIYLIRQPSLRPWQMELPGTKTGGFGNTNTAVYFPKQAWRSLELAPLEK